MRRCAECEHIFPLLRKVDVYNSPKNAAVPADNDVCSAKPVVTDFEITVNELFKI